MEQIVSGNVSLKNSYLAYRGAHPKKRIRDAARDLGVSEAEVLASFAGASVVRLEPRFRDLWKRMGELGRIMSLTRNEYCVHERKGVFENIRVENPHVGFVAGPDIDLRMFFTHWAFGFAVFDDDGAGFKKSFQLFDREGTAVIKIFMLPESDHQAFERLTREFSEAEQGPAITVRPFVAYVEPPMPAGLDVEAFHRAWGALKDTHDFYPMIRKFKLSRHQALVWGGPFTRQVDLDTPEKLLRDAAASGMQIMVFTSSRGNIQIHSGAVRKILEIPGWINVMDPDFNLHLRTDGIHDVWAVKKPTADGWVHSLEVFDPAGELIVQFFGKRKPGIPESADWAAYVDILPALS